MQSIRQGSKKTVFKKSPTQWVFGVLLGFLDKQEKIGKIIQKLCNLKPSFKTIKYCIISGI